MLRYGLTQVEKSESVFIPVVGPRTGVMTPNTLASFTACPASFPAGALVGLATRLLAPTCVFAHCTRLALAGVCALIVHVFVSTVFRTRVTGKDLKNININ